VLPYPAPVIYNPFRLTVVDATVTSTLLKYPMLLDAYAADEPLPITKRFAVRPVSALAEEAVVAVAALPVILIPQVPLAPEPVLVTV